jgi:hypothetical protein
MDKKNTQNKKVFIKTISGRNYTGIITNEDSNFISIIDKFGLNVRISVKDIEVIEEVRE